LSEGSEDLKVETTCELLNSTVETMWRPVEDDEASLMEERRRQRE